jgi:hypothetical protein
MMKLFVVIYGASGGISGSIGPITGVTMEACQKEATMNTSRYRTSAEPLRFKCEYRDNKPNPTH